MKGLATTLGVMAAYVNPHLDIDRHRPGNLFVSAPTAYEEREQAKWQDEADDFDQTVAELREKKRQLKEGNSNGSSSS